MTRDASGAPAISDHLLENYRRDGAVCLRGAFDQRWLDIVAAGIERNLHDPTLSYKNISAPGATGRYLTGAWNWFKIPEFRDFAHHSPAGAIAGRLMEAECAVFLEDNWFIKEPGALGRTPWHQDEPYYHVRGNFCSIWIPLDPLDASNSIEFVAGSHRWNKLFMPSNFEDESPRDEPRVVDGVTYEITPNIEADRANHAILSWSLEPGDCVVFSARTLHGAPANIESGKTSRRLSTRWADGAAQFIDKKYRWTSFVPDHGLMDGDLLRGPKFPVAWQRRQQPVH